MPDPDRLMELIVEWDERRRAGRDVPATELCPDDTELQDALHRRLEKRRKLQAYLVDPGSTADERERGTDPIPAVAGYTIEAVVGSGGMGVVYRARDDRLNRVVALKMIRSGAGSPETELRRFRTEAEAVAALHHSNIVQIYEIGETRNQPYLALEFVAGGTLTSLLQHKPLPQHRAAEILLRLAEAVSHAHAAGVIHRDLKPSNVLITKEGEPKIADFGLAKRLDSDSAQTQTGSILGSPSYMAPEQAEGRTNDLGPLTDIYALGTVLYEMLTGRPPFLGTTMLETLEHVRTLDPVRIRELQPGVSKDLETICLKCMEKRPADRFSSASALANDLRRFLAREPIDARPPSVMEAFVRTIRRQNYDPQFSRYGRAMLVASPLTLLTYLGITVACGHRVDFPFIAIWVGLVCHVLLQGGLSLANRRLLLAVPPRERRQMNTVWWSVTLMMSIVWGVVRLAIPPDHAGDYLVVFPLWLLLAALGYIAFAGDFGVFFVVAGLFIIGAFVSAFFLPWSPLILGSIVSVNLLVQGLAMEAQARQLDREGRVAERA